MTKKPKADEWQRWARKAALVLGNCRGTIYRAVQANVQIDKFNPASHVRIKEIDALMKEMPISAP